MKRLLPLVLIIAFIFHAKAQVPTCSLDPVFISSNKVGVWPDSATNFVSGMVGNQYGRNITLKIPDDTTQGSIHFCFSRFELSTPSSTVANYNLPPGLNFAVNTASLQNGTVNGSPSFKFPAADNHCAIITGTPTTAGTYTLQMKVVAYANIVSGTCPYPPPATGGFPASTQTLKYYIIKIDPYQGIIENEKPDFDLQNFPNPFTGKTKIKFTVRDQSPVKLTVHNTLGSKIFETSIAAQPGDNEYNLNAGSWNE